MPRTFVGRDTVQFFLPIEKAVHEAWRHRQVPLWMPEVSFGRPIAGNPNAGAFYPVRIAVSPLPFPLSAKLFPVLHIWLAGLGAFSLARFLGTSAWGSTFGAVVYALGGPALSDVDYPNCLPGLAVLPFVLLAAAAFSRRPSSRRAAAFGVAWGLSLLAGDVFGASLALAGSALLAWQEAPAGVRGRALGGLLLASAPGFLVAAIQIVPAAHLTPLTVRWREGLSVGEASRWSVSLWRLLEFLVPFPFGNGGAERLVWGDRLWSGRSAGFFYTLYPGVLASACVLLWRAPSGKRFFLYLFGAGSLIAASIGFYLPTRLAGLSSPLPLRYPEKFMAGVMLVVALWTGFAIDRMVGKLARHRVLFPLFVSLALMVGAVVAAAAPEATARFANRHWTSSPQAAATASARMPALLRGAAARWCLLAGLLSLWTEERRKTLLASSLVLLVVDLGSVGKSFLATDSNVLVFREPPSVRAVKRLNRGLTFGFTPLEDYVFPERRDQFQAPYQTEADKNRNSLRGFVGAMFGVLYAFNIDYDLSDFSRVQLARKEFLRENGAWPGVAGYAGAFSARTAISRKGQVFDAFAQPASTVGPDRILVNVQARPSVRFAREIVHVRDLRQAWARIHERQVDLSRTTLVETGDDLAESLPGGEIRVVAVGANGMTLETRASGPARLVLARAYSPFRDVRVDRRPWPEEPANLCLTSIVVPAGSHTVSIRERLPGGVLGPIASLLGVLTLLFLAMRRA